MEGNKTKCLVSLSEKEQISMSLWSSPILLCFSLSYKYFARDCLFWNINGENVVCQKNSGKLFRYLVTSNSCELLLQHFAFSYDYINFTNQYLLKNFIVKKVVLRKTLNKLLWLREHKMQFFNTSFSGIYIKVLHWCLQVMFW